jgi:accessory colonization factor AcfC
MTVTDVLKSAHFVVDHAGNPTAVVLDIAVWEAFLAALEDVEDSELVRERLKNWRTKQGWTSWEDFEAELDADALPSVDRE